MAEGEGVGSIWPWTLFSLFGTKRSVNMAWTSEGKSRLLSPAPGIESTSIWPNIPAAGLPLAGEHALQLGSERTIVKPRRGRGHSSTLDAILLGESFRSCRRLLLSWTTSLTG